MLACVFLIMTAYYVMKTVREGLILASGGFGVGGDELKIYASGAMALLLVAIVPAYSALANRVRRMLLINVSYAVVIVSLVTFFALARVGVSVALPFFVWLGLVSLFLVGQFWSYANDIYSEEQGERLFAIIAIGGSLGAIAGPKLAKLADTFSMMLFAAALLLAVTLLFNVIELVHRNHHRDPIARQPITGDGGFRLVLHDRYLLLIACLVVVANIVNTIGEYVLSNAVRNHALELFPSAADEAARRELIKGFFSDFFMWVNLVGFVLQAFLVSRVIRRLGVRGALFVLPVIAFGVYGAIGAIGGIALIRIAKISEDAIDYSLQNTVRQTLFLPTARAAKYKAKAAIDTFFVRAGDTLAAVLVGIGLHTFGLSGRQLALVNLALIAGWIAIAAGIARRHRVSTEEVAPPSQPPALRPAGAHA